MGVDDNAVRDLRLDLKQTTTSTELRLPSAIGFVNWSGLGFFGLVGLLFAAFLAWTAWRGPERSIVPIVISSTIAIGMIFLLYWVIRWLRYGAVVRITPERLAIRKHWSSGLESIAIDLSQVRFEPDRRGILVAGGRRTMRIGTGLGVKARHSVVEFLTGLIAGHLGADVDSMGRIAAAAEPASSPEATSSTATATPSDVDASTPGADLVLLALCRRCLQADTGDRRSVHIAPDIPPAMLTAALESYLEIRDDEILLGIVGARELGLPGAGCALTTRRIYWKGTMFASSEGTPPRCRCLDYSALPETIGLAGSVSPAVVLGKGNRIRAAGGRKIQDALVSFLKTARSLALGSPPESAILGAAGLEPYGDAPTEAERNAVGWAWPRVVAGSREAWAHQAEIRGFQGRFLAARGLVTWAIVGACLVVYALTVAAANRRDLWSFSPDNDVMFRWGAEFGPSVVYDGEYWRLFACMFLHFGLLHLLLNMYCLATAGPLVERLFGHVGFAGLYAISGVAGSLASLCVHPTVLAAGASGAIFGVFGGLLGFLALRHQEVPAAKLRPMAGGALAFVGYNTIFALWTPGIDMAAHLGGLAGGFVCGLMLTGATPARSAGSGRIGPALKRLAVLSACSAILAASWPRVSEFAHGRILADPGVGRKITERREAQEAWNTFHTAAAPSLQELDRISGTLDELFSGSRRGAISRGERAVWLVALQRDCMVLGARIPKIPGRNDEIRQMRRRLASAQASQLEMINAFLPGPSSAPRGPEGFAAWSKAYNREIQSFQSLVDAYFRTYSLERQEMKP